jgi:hypothetical protein
LKLNGKWNLKEIKAYTVSLFRIVHYLGEMCKRQDSSVRYSEGPGFESWSGCTFFSPCDIWCPTWDRDDISSEFNFTLFSLPIRNSRTNFNIAGEYVTVQNCSLFRGKYVSGRIAQSVEPRYGILRVRGSSLCLSANLFSPCERLKLVDLCFCKYIAFYRKRYDFFNHMCFFFFVEKR